MNEWNEYPLVIPPGTKLIECITTLKFGTHLYATSNTWDAHNHEFVRMNERVTAWMLFPSPFKGD